MFKKEVRREPYLSSVKSVKDRISLTKFRLSNHDLMIEKGRHLKLKLTERKCSFCKCIEDEKHFLLNCPTFSILRNELIDNVTGKLGDSRGDDENILKYLLGNTEIAPLVAKYLTKALELRSFLVDSPKRLI